MVFKKFWFCFSEPIPFQVIFVAVKCIWFFLTFSGGLGGYFCFLRGKLEGNFVLLFFS